MSENTDLTYYQRNRESLKKQARDKCRNLSEEEKNKKREYGKNRCHNMSEDYREAKKSQYNN